MKLEIIVLIPCKDYVHSLFTYGDSYIIITFISVFVDAVTSFDHDYFK